MGDNGKGEGRPAAPARGGCLGGLLGTLGVAAVILLAFGFVAARTDGFRAYVEDRIEKSMGARFSVERSRVGWPYELALEGVKLAPAAAGEGEGEAREVRVGLAPDGTRQIKAMGIRLILRKIEPDDWQPAVAAGLGDVRRLSQFSELAAGLDERLRLRVSDASIEWRGDGGERQAWAEGVSFDVTPVSVPGRVLRHYRLRVRVLGAAGAAEMRDVTWEWIATPERPYIEIHSHTETPRVTRDDAIWPAELIEGGEAP